MAVFGHSLGINQNIVRTLNYTCLTMIQLICVKIERLLIIFHEENGPITIIFQRPERPLSYVYKKITSFIF